MRCETVLVTEVSTSSGLSRYLGDLKMQRSFFPVCVLKKEKSFYVVCWKITDCEMLVFSAAKLAKLKSASDVEPKVLFT